MSISCTGELTMKRKSIVEEVVVTKRREYESFCVAGEQLLKKEEDVNRDRELLSAICQRLHNIEHQTSVLCLSTGGKTLRLSRSVLQSYPHKNYFISLLSGKYDHLLPRDQNGKIFFDLCAKWIDPMLNLCRDLAMWNGDEKSKPIQSPGDRRWGGDCLALNKYFCPNLRSTVRLQFHESVMLDELNQQHELSVAAVFTGCSASAQLLYRGSRDGFQAKDFHNKCDGKPNTVCIIKDNEDNVFGGYAALPWSCDHGWKLDSDAFLFSIAAKGAVNVQKHPLRASTKNSVYHSEQYACIFGGNGGATEIIIFNVCNSYHGSSGGNCETFDTSNSTIQMWQSTSVHNFTVQEMEVFQLTDTPQPQPSAVSDNSKSGASSTAPSDDGGGPGSAVVVVSLESAAAELDRQTADLLREAQGVLNELHFVARHTGGSCEAATADTAAAGDAAGDAAAGGDFQSVLAQIEPLYETLQKGTAPVVEAVTIDAGGTLITTTKDTLRQAPEGSPLANMASDAWGHDLDSDGNIYQDVNSELFVAIINHLRLKQLLGGTSIQVPPIVVYEEQKTALDNLLAFYMLTDYLPVKTIKYIA